MLNPLGKFFKLLIVRIKPMRIRGECMEKRPVKKKWYRQLIQLIVVALGGVGRVGYFAAKLKYSIHATEHLANPARQMSKSATVLVRSFGRKHIDKRNPHDRFVQTLGKKHIVVSKTKKNNIISLGHRSKKDKNWKKVEWWK